MADSTRADMMIARTAGTAPLPRAHHLAVLALGAAALLLIGGLLLAYLNTAADAPLVVESTFGQLALWMAEQSALAAPEALLGQFARTWAGWLNTPTLDAETALAAMRALLLLLIGLALVCALGGLLGLARGAGWTRTVWLLALLGLDTLLFIVPPLRDASAYGLILGAVGLLLLALMGAPGRVTRLLGFMVIISALLLAWEGAKAFGAATGYRIALPQPGWTPTAYPALEAALAALANGEAAAVIADAKDLRDIIPAAGADPTGMPYPELRLLGRLESETRFAGLPIVPAFPGRLGVAARAADAERWTAAGELVGQPVAAVSGSFALDKFLSEPRALVLLDLKITNDLNLPHLQSIALALFQPARRAGPLLLVRILGQAGLNTWATAAVGFVFGGLLGFGLGTLFAHSRLMERGLLPYVVASQTVPILAIAPMVVIWLGAGWLSVAVISAYLTFFPVTINTLRGLTSPHPTALELMHSYAASRWTTLWKLRFPAALPYIFTALKVSATASVVGAIIGELPSGMRDGLGGAILNFNQYYTSDPAKLWAAILISALVGIAFFLLVTLVERQVLKGYVREV